LSVRCGFHFSWR